MSSVSLPTLHVWPAKWDLPSIEPSSLAAILYLQLAIPGRFAVQECTNPDISPSGQLPYLSHGLHVVAPASSIFKYVAALSPASLHAHDDAPQIFSADLDALLSSIERSKRTAWCAHIETTLGDLVAHVFYSLPANYAAVTYPAFALLYPIPQRYYVPNRIRQSYQARLEASGLWNLPGEEIEKESERKAFGEKEKTKEEDPKKVFKSAFERERVLEKARAAFDLYTRLLGDNRFFYYDRPTTLDVQLAAHILLLVNPPFPDTLLSSLISSSYPTLLTHARRVLSTAFPASTPSSEQLHMLPPLTFSLRELLPYPTVRWGSGERKAKTDIDKRFDRMRWGWIGLTVLGAATYLAVMMSKGRITFQLDDEEEEEEEEEEDGGDILEEDELPKEEASLNA
ncbi:hypothetical protein BV25DRAFT_1800262 [Artomyces pyxidatus]|uniref:Uncharacterized protein n=1 Tax=Artomyces pyxidatus TaxID=48021 RepID=A0ACB8T6T6_9AGAM|nr:hypothetical protein BV25DRAFT_1800262 [Artomyces pyxidatus]